jgi:type II secretory pathway component GspD/PulD (secretin)
LCAGFARGEDFAERLYKEGQKAEKAGDKFHAFLLYSQAAALAPLNAEFAMRKAALQADAAMSATTRLEVNPAKNVPSELTGDLTDSDLLDAKTARMPPRLKSSEGLKSFDVSGDPKDVIEKVFAVYGLTPVFDSGYQTPRNFRYRIENLHFDEALRALETLSDSFFVPVNERVALVVRDTAQKRAELSPAMSIAIPIPERMSVQEAQEMMQAVQGTLEIRKFSLDPVKRVVYLRDQVSKIASARTMFADLSRLRAQVEVDVEFLEVTKNSSLGYGLQLPATSSALVDFGTKFLHNKPATPSSFTQFLTFGGGATFFGVGVMASTVLATFNKSNSSTMLKTQIVTVDGQAASLHVGERYPVITASYSGGTVGATGAANATGLAAPPTINFEDLGLVLKVTPSIHDQGEVTLDISSEFRVLGALNAEGIPTISSRKYEGKVRLKLDESAIVAGLIATTDGDTRSGVYGLASLPVIGRFLRSNTVDHTSSEVLLVLRPRLLDLPQWEFPTKTIWVGTETKPISLF